MLLSSAMIHTLVFIICLPLPQILILYSHTYITSYIHITPHLLLNSAVILTYILKKSSNANHYHIYLYYTHIHITSYIHTYYTTSAVEFSNDTYIYIYIHPQKVFKC